MKTVYQTFDGRFFDHEADAEAYEETVLEAAFNESRLNEFLATLDNKSRDEWFMTDHALATHFFERLLTWCRENNKTLTVVDN